MKPITKIAIAGAGKVATHLTTALQGVGYEITGIWNHLSARGRNLAERLDVNFITHWEDVDADLIIIAVSDDAIPGVSSMLSTDIPVVHTSGNTTLDVLKQERKGVFWPLQTFSQGQDLSFDDIPICIESNDASLEWELFEMGKKLSSSVQIIDHKQRKVLHLAAVFACNFSNALYGLSADLLSKHELPFKLLHELISETARKATIVHPLEAQTGPAMRGDTGVMNTQLQTLEEEPQWQDIYSTLTQLILDQQHGKKL